MSRRSPSVSRSGAATLLLLAACTSTPRLDVDAPVQTWPGEGRRFRLPAGAVELAFTPSDARARLTLVRGAERAEVPPRLDGAAHRLLFAETEGLELEVRGAPDAGVVTLSATKAKEVEGRSLQEVAALDAAFVKALSLATPPTAAGQAEAAQRLGEGAARAEAWGDAERAGAHRLAEGELRWRLGDPGAEAAFAAAVKSAAPETRAAALLGLARLEQERGRLERAAAHLAAARTVVEGRPLLAARLAPLQGSMQVERAAWAEAIAGLTPALVTARQAGDEALVAALESGLGWAWKDQGEREEALAHFERGALAARRSGDDRLIGRALHDLGVIRSDFDGDWAGALPFFRQAAEALQRAGDRAGLAFSLDAAGEMESTLGDAVALQHHAQALVLRRALGALRGEAQTLTSLGSAYTRLHRPEEARAPLREAAGLFGRLGDTSWEAYAWFRLGRAELEAGNFPEAVGLARKALGQAESLRERIASDDRRASYTASVRDFFDLWVAAACAQARATGERRWLEAAFEGSERARARSLLEVVLRIDADRPAALRGEDDLLRAQLRELELELRRERALGAAEEALAPLEQRLQTKLVAWEALTRKAQAADPRTAELTHPPLATLADAERLTGRHTLVVEYFVGRRGSWALVVGGGAAPRAWPLPSSEVLRPLVSGLFQAAAARNQYPPDETAAQRAARVEKEDARAEAARLALRSAVLPFTVGQEGLQQLVVVADDALHLVPWAAVVPELPVVAAPSLSVLLAQRRLARPAPGLKLVVVGDPVFGDDDVRLGALEGVARPEATRGEERFRRLAHAAEESDALAALVPAAQRAVWVGFEASKERVRRSGFGQARLVHFATHAVFDGAQPERSGLVLARRAPDGQPVDGFLTLAEVYGLRLPADLVTLSACETALGAEVRGEGLIGLARGFLHAGARAVLASLWKVDDRATAALMTAFYEGVLRLGLAPAQALARAQRTLAAQGRFRAPYYWAGFVLVGAP